MQLPKNYKYRPLPEGLHVFFSAIDGMGLFASNPIAEGTVLGITHVPHEDFENGLIRTPLGGFVNHSTEPNVEIIKLNDYYYLRTLRDITVNEELVADYYNSDCAKNCGFE